MRTLTHGDVVTTARALLSIPQAYWRGEILRLLDRAHAADLFRKRSGRAHPFWGNGCLMAAAPHGADLSHEPFLSDPRYLEAMAAVIDTILDWRRRAQ